SLRSRGRIRPRWAARSRMFWCELSMPSLCCETSVVVKNYLQNTTDIGSFACRCRNPTVRRGREAEEPIDGEPCGAIKPAQLRSQALAGSAKRAFEGEY